MPKEKIKTKPGIKTSPKSPSPIRRTSPSVSPNPKAYSSQDPEEGWDNLSWGSQRG